MEYFRPEHPNTTVYISLLAILTALTTVATIVLIVPFPTTSGYFNLGDVLVMISGLLLGPIGGFVAGGIGSAIADLIVAPQYAPITLIAKGFEGMIVGLLSAKTLKATRISIWDVTGVILASCAMLLGYLLGEMFILEYSFGVALAELVTINSIQVIVGSLITLSIGPVLRSYLRDITYKVETPLEADPP
ncbi:MAG: ECF transporter S component [Candidatus Thorarchaeota archaeon]